MRIFQNVIIEVIAILVEHFFVGLMQAIIIFQCLCENICLDKVDTREVFLFLDNVVC